MQSGHAKRPKREISAGVVVYRRTREGMKFLILYHRGSYWNFPKGKIESEEKNLAAAFRETREETGLSSKDLRLVHGFKAYQRYSFRENGQPIFKIVIFYLAESRTAEVRISNEHNGYGWFLWNDAKKLLGRYRDSHKLLQQAYDFLRRKSAPRGQAHPARPRPHV